ncbi:MAG TPA: aromatic ring-hydroxylating dioxygenase subunit alpha [Acidisarcina sp.]
MLDDPVLLDEWLAVAWSSTVPRGSLRSQQLLGRNVLLWRSAGGVRAWEDLCIHRGARLSLGQIRNDCVVCPYHFWEYDASGQCVRIPAQASLPPPLRAQARVFNACEKYGLIWVCLGTPRGEPPVFAAGDDASCRKVLAGPYIFEANAPRVIENFLDVAHLPFVHAGLLGDPAFPDIDDYEATISPDGILARDIRVWQPDPDGTGKPAQVFYTYQVHALLTASFTKTQARKQTDGGFLQQFSMLDTVTPVGPRESLAWVVLALNYAHDVSDAELRSFQDRISAQDKPIVESQRPELLPLDLQAELHVRSDRMAIAYRRWLKQRGLRYGTA